MMLSFLGEEFYEASPYEPVTSRLSDIFRLASIFSGKWACAGASRFSSGPGAADRALGWLRVLACSASKPLTDSEHHIDPHL